MHDEKYMIAVCPTCHDAIHNGSLEITDEILYRWKGIKRQNRTADILFVEPSKNTIMKLGQIEIVAQGGMIVFAPSPNNALKYVVENDDIILVSCEVSDRAGNPIIKITDNRICLLGDRSKYTYLDLPGHKTLVGPAQEIIEPWMIDSVRTRDQSFALEFEVIFDIEVTVPGQVKVKGIWCDGGRCLVVRDNKWIIPRTNIEAMQVDGGGTIKWLKPSIDRGFFETDFKLW